MVLGKILTAACVDKRTIATVEFDPDPDADLIYQKVLSGTLKGVSVGYCVDNWEEVAAGKISTSGRFAGPCYVALRWTPYEISIVSIPADATVGVGRSLDEQADPADGCEAIKKQEEDKMDEKKLETTPEKSVPAVDVAAIRAEEAAKVQEINAMCREFGVDPAAHLTKSVDEVRIAILSELKAKSTPVRTEVVVDEGDKIRAAVSDALLIRSSAKVEKPAPGANDFRGLTLMEMARHFVERSGVSTKGMGKMELAREAMVGTSDFPAILADVANKSMRRGFQEAATTWQIWCGVGSAPDFKNINRVQLSGASNMTQVLPGGEYTVAAINDSKETYAILTYGKKFAITRQAIINDDLQAFTRIPLILGQAANRQINIMAYGILTANANLADGVALFNTATHKNLEATTKTAPTVAALSVARAAMAVQKDISGVAPLNLDMQYIIVPKKLQTVAEQLILSAVDPAKSNATVNPFNRIVVVSDAILDTADADKWYAAASPNQIDTVEVSFLDGVQTPYIEQQQGWDVDGLEYKVRIDAAAKALDYRGLYCTPGK